MADADVAARPGDAAAGSKDSAARRIERHRGLPGGRAVVGAFLVAAAAIAVFAAYLDAMAEPETQYLVAADAIAPGTLIADRELALTLFGSLPLALTAPVDGQVFAAEELDELVGQAVVSAVGAGELLQRSNLLDQERVPDSHVMSFALPVADAVSGALTPGELVDVVATYRTGSDAHTAYVVRAVPVLGVDMGSGGSSVILTVAIADPVGVQALGHAVNTASVFVTTSTADVDVDADLPSPYRTAPAGDAEPEGTPAQPGGSPTESGASPTELEGSPSDREGDSP